MIRVEEAALERLLSLPRRGLPLGPTPLSPAPALGERIGLPGLWIKHEELVGFGFGGNKVRALDLIVADALAAGADALVTGAGPQSNYVRAAAAAAAHAGLAMQAVYWGEPPPGAATGNLALTRLLGATVRFTGSPDRASVDGGIADEVARRRAAGGRPYPIPRGGACALGALGQVLTVRELQAQLAERHLAPSAVVMAVGSGATLAGWALGRDLLGARFSLEGVVVSRPASETAARVATLAGEAAARLGLELAAPPAVALHDGFLGPGYGVPTDEGLAAIRLAARSQGLFLDPTYTGKALAGLMALAARGAFPRERPIVFVHSGGEPALLAAASALS